MLILKCSRLGNRCAATGIASLRELRLSSAALAMRCPEVAEDAVGASREHARDLDHRPPAWVPREVPLLPLTHAPAMTVAAPRQNKVLLDGPGLASLQVGIARRGEARADYSPEGTDLSVHHLKHLDAVAPVNSMADFDRSSTDETIRGVRPGRGYDRVIPPWRSRDNRATVVHETHLRTMISRDILTISAFGGAPRARTCTATSYVPGSSRPGGRRSVGSRPESRIWSHCAAPRRRSHQACRAGVGHFASEVIMIISSPRYSRGGTTTRPQPPAAS